MGKKSTKVTEAIDLNGPWDIYGSTGFDFPWNSTQGWLTGSPWGGYGMNSYGFSQQYDQGYGFVKPVYLTTYQLKMIRERSRQLAFYNEYCSAVIKIFQDYVVGDGFKYQVVPTRDGVNEKLVKQTQELIDLYCEHNEIHQMESEFVWRLLVEGEACSRSFEGSNGLITTRWVENDLILPPSDSNDPDISFGISCRHDDIHDIKGYWIVTRPWEGLTPELIGAEEINYTKVLTPSNSKRGLPYSFAVDQNFRSAEAVLAAMISLAVSRSKVSLIRKVQNAPPEGLANLTNKTTDIKITNPVTGQGKMNLEVLPNSSVLTSSANIEYEFPDINLGSQDSEITLMNNLRAICAHYGISEVQLSQNIGSGSYASHIVQESPSYKTFVRWQKMLGEYFAGRRQNPNRSLMWKQVEFAVRKGLLPENAITDVKISYQGPSLLTREPLHEAQTNKIYVDMGVKSAQTVAAEQGFEYDEQQKQKENDNSLENVMKTVTLLRANSVSTEAGKKLMKKYHPNLEDEIINELFSEQNVEEQPQENGKQPEGQPRKPKTPSKENKTLKPPSPAKEG